MKKICFTIFFLVSMAACATKKSDLYYYQNPKALSDAIAQCQTNQPTDLDCVHISAIALTFQQQSQQLRLNPQQYGMKIIELQNELVSMRQSNNAPLNDINAKEKQLNLYLSIVKVFESPEQ